MLRRLFAYTLSILLFLCFLSSGRAQQVEPKLQSLMEQHKAVGLAAVVVKNGKIIYEKSFGYKHLESQTLLSPKDIFRIASISKSFSATAIMQLLAKKKLSLDDDVSDLIGFKVRNPKYPDVPITLRMLLSHRSSLNDSRGYFTLDSINPAVSANWEKCYNDYKPGTKYQYCNLNFNIVGTIIERVSGERFDEYIRRHILEPLKLYGGYCVDSLNSDLFVTLYEYDRGKQTFTPSEGAYTPRREEIRNYKMGYSTPIFSPTGGMKISAGDLARYMIMHMNYGKSGKVRIIPKKYARLMQTPVAPDNGYGLALTKNKNLIPGLELTGHTGSAYGLYSTMFFDPKKQFGFVVITNGCVFTSDGDTTTLLKKAINILYEEFIK